MSLGFFWKILPASVFSAVVLAGCAAPPTKPVPQTFSALAQFYGTSMDEVVYNPEFYGKTSLLAYSNSPPLSFAMAVYANSSNVHLVDGVVGGAAVDPLALGAMSATPGSNAFGALALLDILGSLPASNGAQYDVSSASMSKIPFLEFYKIIPTDEAKKMTVRDYFDDLKVAVSLEVAAHDGTVETNDSISFEDAKFMSHNLSDNSLIYGGAPVQGVMPFKCWKKIGISWSYHEDCTLPNTDSRDLEIGTDALPSRGKAAVLGAGEDVYVNTARPISNGFLTQSELGKMLMKAPLPEGWYAVYNTEVNGQVEVAVLYNGETTYFPLKK